MGSRTHSMCEEWWVDDLRVKLAYSVAGVAAVIQVFGWKGAQSWAPFSLISDGQLDGYGYQHTTRRF